MQLCDNCREPLIHPHYWLPKHNKRFDQYRCLEQWEKENKVTLSAVKKVFQPKIGGDPNLN